MYIPYKSGHQLNGDTAMIAFLGHEQEGVSSLVNDLEPKCIVFVIGYPGFSLDFVHASESLNKMLLQRVKFDGKYRLVKASAYDVARCASIVVSVARSLCGEGFGQIALAPLGTKLQAMSLEVFRQKFPK